MQICKILSAALVFVFLAVCSTAQHASNGGPRPLVGGPRQLVGGPHHGGPRGNYRPLQAHEAAEVDRMVTSEDAAYAAQIAAAGAVAQQRTDQALHKGDDSQGILPPMDDGMPVAPDTMGGFKLPLSAIQKGPNCVPTCMQPCKGICSQHEASQGDCDSVCAEMCDEGCDDDDKDDEKDEDIDDCVPGCLSDCTPSCMKEAKTPQQCSSECNEFCDRDCTERDKMATLLDDGLLEDGIGGDSVDGHGGASPDGDDDIGLEDGALDDLIHGDGDQMLPGGPDCSKKCERDCGDDCKEDEGEGNAKCIQDCAGECKQLCAPLDPHLAGTDGDKLLDIAEHGASDSDPDGDGDEGEEDGGFDAKHGDDDDLSDPDDDDDPDNGPDDPDGPDGDEPSDDEFFTNTLKDLDSQGTTRSLIKRRNISTGAFSGPLGWLWTSLVVVLTVAFGFVLFVLMCRVKAFGSLRLPGMHIV